MVQSGIEYYGSTIATETLIASMVGLVVPKAFVVVVPVTAAVATELQITYSTGKKQMEELYKVRVRLSFHIAGYNK